MCLLETLVHDYILKANGKLTSFIVERACIDIVTMFLHIKFGPSGVRELPLAAGINEGGHYFRYFGPSGVRAPAVST